MKLDFDLKKSIKSERIKYRKNLYDRIINFIGLVCLCGLVLILPGLVLIFLGFSSDVIGINEIFQISFGFILVGFGIFLIRNYTIIDKLYRIRGINKENNFNLIKEIIEEYDLELIYEDSNYVIAMTYSLINWKKRILIIFDQQDILVNSTYLGRHNLSSPLFFKGNFKELNIVKYKINKTNAI